MPLTPTPTPTPTLWTLPIPSESSVAPSFLPTPTPTKRHDSIWRVDYNAMVERDAAMGWEGLGYVLLLNTLMFSVAFLIFQSCARSTRFSLFGFRTSSTSPPPARFTLQKWAKLLWRTPIQGTDIETRLGPEGTFYLVYQVYALRFLLVLSVYAVCVLIPLYLSVNAGLLPHTSVGANSTDSVGVGSPTQTPTFDNVTTNLFADANDRNATTNKWWSFTHTTIRTLPNDSPYLWVPVVTCYLFTAAFLFFFHHVSSLASIPKGDHHHHQQHHHRQTEPTRRKSAPTNKKTNKPVRPPRTPVKKAQEPAQQTEELPVSSSSPPSSSASSITLLPLPSAIASTNSSVSTDPTLYTNGSTLSTNSLAVSTNQSAANTNSSSSSPSSAPPRDAVIVIDDLKTDASPPSASTSAPPLSTKTSSSSSSSSSGSSLLHTQRLAGMQPSALSLRTIFVDRYFPKHLREERLLFLLQEVFPGYVDDVCVVYNLSKFFWIQSTRERKEARFARDQLLHSSSSSSSSSPSWSLRLLPGSMQFPFVHLVLQRWFCCRSPSFNEADALRQIQQLKQQEEELLADVVHSVHGAGRAFIVFKSARLRARFVRRVRNASVASILAKFPDADIPRLKKYVRELGITRWHLSAAPEPDDIDWLSVSFPIVQRTAAVVLVNVAILAMLLAFTSPVAVTSAISSSSSVSGTAAKSLSDFVAHISDVVEEVSPQMAKMMTSYIPTLILVLINAVLLNVLQLAGRIQPIATDSAKERNILRTSAVYLIFNTLFVPSLALVSIDAVLLYLETDGQVLDMLGTLFLHNSGVFYVNYVLQRCFLGTAVSLLRVSEYAKFCWEKPRAVTAQEHVAAVEAWSFFTGTYSALQISMLAVVMTFSTVVPLIVPIGALYFAMQHAVDKYALLFVRPRIKGRGSIARTATHATMLSLLIYLGAMSGFFLVRGSTMQSSAVLVLLMGTYVVSLWWYIRDKERAYGQTRKGHHVHGPQCKHNHNPSRDREDAKRRAQQIHRRHHTGTSQVLSTTMPPSETTPLLLLLEQPKRLDVVDLETPDDAVVLLSSSSPRPQRRSSVVGGGGHGGSEESDLYRAPALRKYGKNAATVRAAVEMARRASLYGTWHGQSMHEFGAGSFNGGGGSTRGSAPHTPVTTAG